MGSNQSAGTGGLLQSAGLLLSPVCAGITYTLGGISIDEHARALRPGGEPIAGLSVSGPSFRMALEDAARIGTLVRAAADQVTLATGGMIP